MHYAVLLLTRAMSFAADQHTGQRRKGAAAEPYVNHLAEVADLVARATEGCDPALVAAAILHDTIEDTGATYEEIVRRFGPDVADLVAEVTDNKSLLKEERKRLQVVNAPHKSSRAKLIKLADKISNLRAIAASPPADWSAERQRDYVAWARQVGDGLKGANPWLEKLFEEAATQALAAVDVQTPAA